MTTQFPEDSSNAMETWKAKYKEAKQQCGVAEIDAPGATKDSRENLHTVQNATDSLKDWRTFWKDVLDEPKEESNAEDELTLAKQKTVEYFLDTISCALEEINGEEVFNCLLMAVQSHHEYIKKEYDKANVLMDLLIGLK